MSGFKVPDEAVEAIWRRLPADAGITLDDVEAALTESDALPSILQHIAEQLVGEGAVTTACKRRWPLWVVMKPGQKLAAMEAQRADLRAAIQHVLQEGRE